MLILARSEGQSIMIGDDITITFLSRQGRQIRIGIDAPDEVSVHREEVYDRIQQEKAETTVKKERKNVNKPTN